MWNKCKKLCKNEDKAGRKDWSSWLSLSTSLHLSFTVFWKRRNTATWISCIMLNASWPYIHNWICPDDCKFFVSDESNLELQWKKNVGTTEEPWQTDSHAIMIIMSSAAFVCHTSHKPISRKIEVFLGLPEIGLCRNTICEGWIVQLQCYLMVECNCLICCTVSVVLYPHHLNPSQNLCILQQKQQRLQYQLVLFHTNMVENQTAEQQYCSSPSQCLKHTDVV